MVTALTSFTTLMVSETFVQVGQITSETGTEGSTSTQPEVAGVVLSSTQMFAIGISAQSWMTGFLIGKISTGTFATGFRYAIILVAISMFAALITQEFNLSPSILLSS